MINKKLKAIASFINKHDTVIDIGCDHAYLAIYLKENKLCKNVYASDINQNALNIAKLCEYLGAGRKSKEDEIDYNAGVIIKKEIGEEVKEGDILASLYTNIDNPIFNLEGIFEIS